MNASYNALRITVEKRLSHHFLVNGFYTFSKDLEDAQLDNNTTNGSAEDYRNLTLERGRSDNDRPDVTVSSLIWDANFYTGTNALFRGVANGWQISAIMTFQSGLPINLTTGADTNLDGVTNDRVNLAGDPYLSSGRSRSDISNEYFNTAAFAVPRPEPTGIWAVTS